VGDEAFTHKCLDKFGEFRRRGKTILLVTHSLNLIERFCDEALWLDGGKTQTVGDPRRVVDAYLTAVERTEEQTLTTADAKARQNVQDECVEPRTNGGASRGSAVNHLRGLDEPPQPSDGFRAAERRPSPPLSGVGSTVAAVEPSTDPGHPELLEGRWGSREVEILNVVLKGQDGQAGHVFQSGDPVSVHLKVRAIQPVSDFAFGIGLFNADGVCCYGTNTHLEEFVPDELFGDAEVAFKVDTLDLIEGTYKLDVAVHKRDGYPYDYHRLLYTFRMKSRTPDVGIYRPRHHWTFSPNVKFK
jgi:hypothetical protein